jgi:hypothetical protein
MRSQIHLENQLNPKLITYMNQLNQPNAAGAENDLVSETSHGGRNLEVFLTAVVFGQASLVNRLVV